MQTKSNISLKLSQLKKMVCTYSHKHFSFFFIIIFQDYTIQKKCTNENIRSGTLNKVNGVHADMSCLEN